MLEPETAMWQVARLSAFAIFEVAHEVCLVFDMGTGIPGG